MERIRRFFRRLGKKIGAKGYTLLEVAAVVAVTGTLAAVAMPVVSDKISSAKVTAATMDVQAVKDTIVNFIKDTGVPPFYSNAINGLALPKENGSGFEYVLSTKDGVDPQFEQGTSWPALLDPTSRFAYSLDGQLIDNYPKYPTQGISAWKGPYIPSLKKDPWGNRYLVTIKWLAEPVSGFEGAIGKAQKAVFVISAGPNGIIETKFSQVIRQIEATAAQQGIFEFKVENDDIVSRIN